MKITSLLKMYIIILMVQALMFGFLACSNDIKPNQKPNININYDTENLKAAIKGGITDSNGIISIMMKKALSK